MEGPVLLVCSAHAGSACPPEEVEQALRDVGVEVARVLHVGELPPEPLGEQWREEGIAAVVAAGGDGTVGTVVTHLGDGPLPLAILPLGTANDSARSLGIPLGLEAAAVVASGRALPMDVGELVDAHGRRGRFLHAATVGLTADFARLATDVEHRERFGALNYPVAAVEALATARARELVMRLDDGRVVEGPALQIAALNMPHLLGGTLDVDIPRVSPRDGLLTFLVMRNMLKIERYEARSARIEAVDEPCDVTIDGEVGGPTPVEIHLLPRRIRVIVPR